MRQKAIFGNHGYSNHGCDCASVPQPRQTALDEHLDVGFGGGRRAAVVAEVALDEDRRATVLLRRPSSRTLDVHPNHPAPRVVLSA